LSQASVLPAPGSGFLASYVVSYHLQRGQKADGRAEAVADDTCGPDVDAAVPIPGIARVFDTHCHLTHPKLLPEAGCIVARAREAGVAACMTIGTGCADARAGLTLARRFPGFVECAAGIDPFTAHAKGEAFDAELAELRELLAEGSFRALGEVGLDYHYDLDPPPVQARKLEAQLDLAVELRLPVVIHVREAHDDMLAILAAHSRCRGIIHSFSGGPAVAERYLALGWHLAFNGVVTFGSGAEVREAARVVPSGRLLVETDAPYLAPQPFRGRRCEPAHVAHTLRRVAEVRGDRVEELAEATTRNARSLLTDS
jgi:TatD DNase family protein